MEGRFFLTDGNRLWLVLFFFLFLFQFLINMIHVLFEDEKQAKTETIFKFLMLFFPLSTSEDFKQSLVTNFSYVTCVIGTRNTHKIFS